MAAALAITLLAIPMVERAAQAAPTCAGKPATKVGTNGPNVINGTKRADVIVARGGKDKVAGRKGGDRVCGGTGADKLNGHQGADRIIGGGGADRITGGDGNDLLKGSAGNDIIFGGDGSDTINGGSGYDRCYPGAGGGSVINCETADFTVMVNGPNNTNSGDDATFTVEVTNNGPDAAPYTLNLALRPEKATCAAAAWVGDHVGGVLASGATDSTEHVASCTKDANGAKVNVDAEVSTPALDPDPLNDTGTGKTNLK